MFTARYSQFCLALCLALAAATPMHGAPDASCSTPVPPSCRPAFPLCPLGSIHTQQELAARLQSGAGWLAGLPGYGSYHGSSLHAGIDLGAPLGDPIFALADGIVDPTSDVPHGGYGPGWTVGRVMIVRSALPDGSPYLIVYGHTQNHRVKGGDVVRAGDMLAEVGPWLESEGGPHLHLTVRLGELPRFGWGTPTLAGRACREGAESAGGEADVLRLGYRNPALLLRGEPIAGPLPAAEADFPPTTTTPLGGQQASLLTRFGQLRRTYEAQLSPERRRMLPMLPLRESVLTTDQPTRWGPTWVQTFRTADGEQGGLIWPDGEANLYWVGGRLWGAYAKAGGPQKVGPPCSEPYDWGESLAQGFTRALLVCELGSGQTRVILRAQPVGRR